MKNIQVIDGALNCTFSIFQAFDEEFALLFPEAGQEIQYAEDLLELPHRKQVTARAGTHLATANPEAGCPGDSWHVVL